MNINEINMNELGHKFYKDVAEDPFFAVRATQYLMLLPSNILFGKAKDDVEHLIKQYAKNKIHARKPVYTVTRGMNILCSIFDMQKGLKIEDMTVGEVMKLIENYYDD